MQDKKQAQNLMDEATDNAAKALEGKGYENSTAIIEQFNNQVDKAGEQASAKFDKKS